MSLYMHSACYDVNQVNRPVALDSSQSRTPSSSGFVDHYESLQISPTANASEIREAYRRLRGDYFQSNPRKYLELQKAFDTLIDEGERLVYDIEFCRFMGSDFPSEYSAFLESLDSLDTTTLRDSVTRGLETQRGTDTKQLAKNTEAQMELSAPEEGELTVAMAKMAIIPQSKPKPQHANLRKLNGANFNQLARKYESGMVRPLRSALAKHKPSSSSSSLSIARRIHPTLPPPRRPSGALTSSLSVPRSTMQALGRVQETPAPPHHRLSHIPISTLYATGRMQVSKPVHIPIRYWHLTQGVTD